jgi:hypothetical protein
MFRRNVLPPFSGSKTKTCRKPTTAGITFLLDVSGLLPDNTASDHFSQSPCENVRSNVSCVPNVCQRTGGFRIPWFWEVTLLSLWYWNAELVLYLSLLTVWIGVTSDLLVEVKTCNKNFERFNFLSATVITDITLCSPSISQPTFRRNMSHYNSAWHLLSRWILARLILRAWRRRRNVPPKLRLDF